jgi:hypothetical protein
LDASAQIVDKYWNTLESPIKKLEAEDVSEKAGAFAYGDFAAPTELDCSLRIPGVRLVRGWHRLNS